MARKKEPFITENALRLYLPEEYQDIPIHVFDTLDSTNDHAKQLAQDGAPHGAVVLARKQTAGRGRMGRSFFSPRDGIYLSMVLRPDYRNGPAGSAGRAGTGSSMPGSMDSAGRAGSGSSMPGPAESAGRAGSGSSMPGSAGSTGRSESSSSMPGSMDSAGRSGSAAWIPALATCAAAVAAAEGMERICGVESGIKWVNDIYVDGKKVCGILTEGITDARTGRIQALITGIGINTSLDGFPDELLDTAGAVEGAYDRSALAAAIIAGMLELTASLKDRRFMDVYRRKSLVMGKTVTVYKGTYRKDPRIETGGRPARVLDIDDDGGLCVLYTDGTRETLVTGEISIRLTDA